MTQAAFRLGPGSTAADGAPAPEAELRSPDPVPDWLDRHLLRLRDSFQRFLHAYHQASQIADEPPDAQAAGRIGLRLDLAQPASAHTRPADAAGLFSGLELAPAHEAVVAAAWWSVADPHVGIAFGWVHDDIARRYPSLAALRLLFEPYGLHVPLALPSDSGPVADGLLRPVADAEAPVRLTGTAALLLDGWRPAAEPGAEVPARLRQATTDARALLDAGHRVVLRCADADDGPVVARAVAAGLGRALDWAPDNDAERPAAETALLARLGMVLPVGESEAPPVRLRLTGPGAAAAPGWQVIDVAAIDPEGVSRAWRRSLAASGLDPRQADELAARMRLPETAIEALCRDAKAAADAERRPVGVGDLHTAVRRHPHHRLDGMARLLPPAITLDDLVLPDTVRSGLADLLAHARHGSAAGSHWPGVRGRAVVALLHGPSGTGKTAATEAVAGELDRDLWVADLAQVVSKWLGETSRNLDRLLTEAARSGAVLLFDEAEGLFGRRGEVSDARDRYANLEIDHLLQRVELHEGLVVLTSNRPAALDEGFQRRIRLSIRFELPDHATRQRIWAALLPPERLAPGVDLAEVAAAELSGAAIRAAALSALVFAAADGRPVDAGHLHRGVRRELEKNGRVWTPRTEQRAGQRTGQGSRT